MAKDYNSAKSNTSTSVKSDSEGGSKALEEFSASPGTDYNSTRSNTTEAAPGGDYNSTRSNTTEAAPGTDYNTTRSNTKADTGGSEKSGAVDHNSSRSNRAASVGDGGGTSGLGTTLGLMKSAFTLTTIIVLIAAGADVYKMYDDHVTINLEDHITDADFWLTPDKNSIEGDIGFDIPKMGYFEKSIDTQIHLKIQESDPTTDDDFYFEYTLGSGEMIYDKFELNNLDPVTKDKIDKGEPLHIEYTVTITIIYLGVELAPTTSEVGTKVTTIQTASES